MSPTPRRRLVGLAGWLLAALLTSASAAAEPPSLDKLFAVPELTGLQLSPDGKHIAGVSPRDDHQTLVVLDTDSGAEVSRLVVPEPRLDPTWLLDGERRIGEFWWVNDTRLLLSVTRQGGHMSYLLLVDSDGTHILENHRRPLKDGLYQQGDDVIDLLPADPSTVLLTYLRRRHGHPFGYEVRRLQVDTAQTERVERVQPDVWSWLTDAAGAVRAGKGLRGSTSFLLYRAGASGPFFELATLGGVKLDPLVARVLAVDGQGLIVASRHEGDRFALYRFDVGEERFSRLLFAHPEVDVTGPLVRDWDGTPVGVRYTDDYDRIHWLAPEWSQRQAEVDAALPGLVNTLESWNSARTRFIVRSQDDRHPPVYRLYLVPERGFRVLARHQPGLDPDALVESRPVRIRARDGLELSAYLTQPPGSQGPVPFLVMPFGGPWPRARRGFDPELQFFASRGLGVLRVNTRGSEGLGQRYETAGYEKWGGAAQDDVADAVAWLVAGGLAAKDRICVYGSGYGGYAALMEAVRHPALYRCAASQGGISDLPAYLAHRDRYEDRELWKRRLGDTSKDLREASPLQHVDDIGVPIFLSHGKQDRVVLPEQSEQLALALRDANKSVIFYQWPHDGHVLKREASRTDYHYQLEHFLRQYLGDPQVARGAPPEQPRP